MLMNLYGKMRMIISNHEGSQLPEIRNRTEFHLGMKGL